MPAAAVMIMMITILMIMMIMKLILVTMMMFSSHLKCPVCQSLPMALVYVPEKMSSSQVPHLGFIFSA